MHALGSARKDAFSVKGAGGTSEVDLDDFDEVYHQMLVVEDIDGAEPEIVGGYRFYCQEQGAVRALDMDRLFYLDKFYQNRENMPAIELGRSFIIPRAQKQPEVFFALFSGLGVILNLFDNAQFFFGKITMYPDNPYNGEVMNFLNTFHKDTDEVISPRIPYLVDSPEGFSQESYTAAFRRVRNHLPEILKIYLRLTEPRYALVSGASSNEEFGEGIFEAAFRIYIPAIEEMWRRKFLYDSSWVTSAKDTIL